MRPVQRATKMLLFDISAFYLLGLALLIKTYCCDERSLFFFVMLFWAKMASVMVGLGMAYWLFCIVRTSVGHAPQAPARFLARAYLAAGIGLLILQVAHWPPPTFHSGNGGMHFYHYARSADGVLRRYED